MEQGAAIPEGRNDLAARLAAQSRARPRRRSFVPDREGIDTLCERGILGTVMAALIWGVIGMGATTNAQFLVLVGLGLVTIALWTVRIWVRQQYRFMFPPFAWVVVSFTGYAIWRYTWSDIEYNARLELLQIVLYAVLFFAVLDNLSKQESIQWLLFTLIGLGLFNAFYAVYQYYADSQKVYWFIRPPTYRGRGSGTYICPNHLAGLLEMVLPIALAYTITGRHKPLIKVFLGYAALAMVAGIGVSISRGGYLAAGAAMFVFFFVLLWNRDFRIPALAILIVMIAGGSFFGFRSWQSQKRFAQLEEHNMRLKYWEPAHELWKENFWFGIGAGHYDWRFRKYRYWKLQGRPIYVHNDYLNTLTEYGTAGGLIVGAGLLALGWGVFRSWKYVRRTNEISSKPSNRSSIVLGCAIGLLAIAFHSVADFNMHVPGNALVAVALMAILSSHLRYATERYWVNPRLAGRIAGTLALLAAGVWMGMQLWRLTPQTYLLGKYFGKLSYERRIELLTRAFAHEPMNSAVAVELGETYREKALEGEDGWEESFRQAIPWFEKALQLNRWNPNIYMDLGMCYDGLKQPEKAGDYFDRALAMDPKNFYLLAMYGWHRLQADDLEGAQKYFKESYSYYWENNPLAESYLKIIERRLAERQTKQ